MDFSSLLTAEERVSFKLRSRYIARGFEPYRMGKFEEYDLYAKNKDFLVDSRVITFTDTDGALLALKPDVTLSIAKNFDEKQSLQKLYYAENVYRPSASGGFREILQSGVECMGAIDGGVLESVLALACECLSDVGERFVLSVSDLGILSALFESMNLSEEEEESLCNFIKGKNVVEAQRLLKNAGVEDGCAELLSQLIITSVSLSEAAALFAENSALSGSFGVLKALSESAELSRFAEKIRFDFSVILNRRFYSGIVFAGYVSSSPRAVLTGGRYDKLMRRLKKKGDAVGFAVYLDRLSQEGLS